mgnify:CR=1 FL=1
MPSRGGRVAVYIEGHAESLERASAAGVASLDKLQAKTAEVDATQRSASTGGFASYTTATSKASKETEKHTRATGRLGKATDLLGSTLKTAAASSVAMPAAHAMKSANSRPRSASCTATATPTFANTAADMRLDGGVLI